MALRALETAHISPLRKDQYLIADVDYYLDTTAAQRALGWKPKWTGTDAILDTFRWFTTERRAVADAPATRAA